MKKKIPSKLVTVFFPIRISLRFDHDMGGNQKVFSINVGQMNCHWNRQLGDRSCCRSILFVSFLRSPSFRIFADVIARSVLSARVLHTPPLDSRPPPIPIYCQCTSALRLCFYSLLPSLFGYCADLSIMNYIFFFYLRRSIRLLNGVGGFSVGGKISSLGLFFCLGPGCLSLWAELETAVGDWVTCCM